MYISIHKLQRIPTPSTLFSNDSSVIGRPTHSKSCHKPLTPITGRVTKLHPNEAANSKVLEFTQNSQ